MRFALIPEEVAASAAATLRNEDPENAEAQALSDWLDINRDPELATVLMDPQDASAFTEARREGYPVFVYIIDRNGELDVYEDIYDAQMACRILGANEFGDPITYQEQRIFPPSSEDEATRDWLAELRDATGT